MTRKTSCFWAHANKEEGGKQAEGRRHPSTRGGGKAPPHPHHPGELRSLLILSGGAAAFSSCGLESSSFSALRVVLLWLFSFFWVFSSLCVLVATPLVDGSTLLFWVVVISLFLVGLCGVSPSFLVGGAVCPPLPLLVVRPSPVALGWWVGGGAPSVFSFWWWCFTPLSVLVVVFLTVCKYSHIPMIRNQELSLDTEHETRTKAMQ